MPTEYMRDWTLEFDLEVGSNFFEEWGDGGAVIYYLQSIHDDRYDMYGYSS